MTEYSKQTEVVKEQYYMSVIKLKESILKLEEFYPTSKYYFKKIDKCNDFKTLLLQLLEFFNEFDSEIDKKNKDAYITDDLDIKISLFCHLLIDKLITFHTELSEHEEYIKVLSNRFIAKGFLLVLFRLRDDNSRKEQIAKRLKLYEDIYDDEKFTKILYVSMCRYYEKFYGRFSDNEEAIELIPYFYIKSIEFSIEEKGRIVNAYFRHVQAAGDTSDFGYAYNGIRLIQKYVNCFPEELVIKIIEKYTLNTVVSQVTSRKQIFNIIEHSSIENKKPYKFRYLDSLVIANAFDMILYSSFKEKDNSIKPYYHSFIEISEEFLAVFKSGDEKYEGGWRIHSNRKLVFDYKFEEFASIELDEEEKIIIISSGNDKPIIEKIDYEDYSLNTLRKVDFSEKLNSLVINMKSDYNFLNSSVTFSYIYVNNYRSMKNLSIDFDQNCSYNTEKNIIELNTEKDTNLSNFYGKSIYSVSCIVGKNGTGKTSAISFLRNTFYEIIRQIRLDKLLCDNGMVEHKKAVDMDLIDESTEFIFVINNKGKSYYLTNMAVDFPTDIKAFEVNSFEGNSLSKFFFFSSMLDVNDLSMKDILNEQHELSFQMRDKKIVGGSLLAVDYSERKHMIEMNNFYNKSQTEEMIEEGKNNLELCYQLAFLLTMTESESEKYFDTNLINHIRISDLSNIKYDLELKSLTNMFEQKFLEEGDEDKLKWHLKNPSSKIRYLSAGQYSKLAFLSRIFWSLKGYNKNEMFFQNILGPNAFDYDHVIHSGETIILFIDEGELYYHPEWQRNYMITLLEMINKYSDDVVFQVIITTNSPFIISDILSKDVTYLPKKNNDSKTFGQNLHTLIKSNFFLNHSMGSFSLKKIDECIEFLEAFDFVNKFCKCECNKKDEEKLVQAKDIIQKYKIANNLDIKNTNQLKLYEYLRSTIRQIGEEIYREKLLETSEIVFKESIELDILKTEKERIEKRIAKLSNDNGVNR